MKIIQREERKKVEFGHLKNGDVFQILNDSKFYMKTEAHYTVDGYMLNTVNIDNGLLTLTDDYIKVIPIDCELVIK